MTLKQCNINRHIIAFAQLISQVAVRSVSQLLVIATVSAIYIVLNEYINLLWQKKVIYSFFRQRKHLYSKVSRNSWFSNSYCKYFEWMWSQHSWNCKESDDHKYDANLHIVLGKMDRM